MLERQGGRCAICGSSVPGSKRGWAVDDDHESGRVRGVLCHQCNLLRGAAKDSPEILEVAIAYIRQHVELKLVSSN